MYANVNLYSFQDWEKIYGWYREIFSCTLCDSCSQFTLKKLNLSLVFQSDLYMTWSIRQPEFTIIHEICHVIKHYIIVIYIRRTNDEKNKKIKKQKNSAIVSQKHSSSSLQNITTFHFFSLIYSLLSYVFHTLINKNVIFLCLYFLPFGFEFIRMRRILYFQDSVYQKAEICSQSGIIL